MSAGPTVTIVMLGNQGVGKSSLVHRFEKNEFTLNGLRETIVADSHKLLVKVKDEVINIQLWDTSGEERYRSITPSYYRKADGILLVYDVTNMETFLSLQSWLEEIRSHNDLAVTVIVGNKNEDPNMKNVNVTTVKNFARDAGMEFYEASAMTGVNVEEIFKELITKILELREEKSIPQSTNIFKKKNTESSTTSAIKLHESPTPKKKKNNCC